LKHIASYFFDVDFISMQKISMMSHNGQKSLCFMLISSLTDKTAAPEGMESGFFLPLAPGINDSEELREEYF
jgi:phytoene desaturase